MCDTNDPPTHPSFDTCYSALTPAADGSSRRHYCVFLDYCEALLPPVALSDGSSDLARRVEPLFGYATPMATQAAHLLRLTNASLALLTRSL